MSKKYTTSRPHIPAAIHREIKIEARFSCITCRERISLHTHHIDGNRENNSSDNLALLCANCHGQVHEGKISAKDLKVCKEKMRGENNILTRVAQELEYLQYSPTISATKDFADLKLKYQATLIDYGDKLIFYQCFIYLIPEFYIDDRGQKIREAVRILLNVDEAEERIIISHLQKLNIIDIVGGLISLRSTGDAKVALNELIDNGRLDLSKIFDTFSSL